MFSTAQLDMIEGLNAAMRKEGYMYYLAYTNNGSSTSNDYDLFIIFSKDEIFAEDLYTYTIPSGSLKYSLRTGNTSYNSSTYYSRIETEEMELIEVGYSISSLQHISTNSTFLTKFMQPDYITEVNTYETTGGLLFTVCAMLFFFAFVKLFRR